MQRRELETAALARVSLKEKLLALPHALDVAERALLADSVSTPKPPPRPASVRGFLSPREQEVLQLVPLGRSNREIARNIFVSESTVKFHVTSILNKLGANTRTEAVSSAMRKGILSIEDPDEAVISGAVVAPWIVTMQRTIRCGGLHARPYTRPRPDVAGAIRSPMGDFSYTL